MLKRDRQEFVSTIDRDSDQPSRLSGGARGSNGSIAARAMAARQERSGGDALDGSTRAAMEASFGSDFSDVRTHEGGAGAARAVARGTDIHFGAGEYDPSSTAGRELLGHELAHVVQQRQGRAHTARAKGGFDHDSGLEREADAAGEKAARGEQVDMAATSGPVMHMAAQAKLNPTRASLSANPRGKSLVTFARILDRLDQYHRVSSASLEIAPTKQVQQLSRILGNISKLCAQWLAKNAGAQGAAAITALSGEARGELATVKAILARREARRKRISSGVVKTKTKDAHGKSMDWVTKDGPLQGRSKHGKYTGEEKSSGKWRNSADPSNDGFITHYFDDQEREKSRLKMGGKGKFRKDGQSLDERSMGWAMNPENSQIHGFNISEVILVDRMLKIEKRARFDKALQLRRSNPARYQIRSQHHSSPLAGRDVAGAGTMDIDRGRIKNVTDQSGHYTPEATYTHQAVKAMAKSGMPMVDPKGAYDESTGGFGTRSAKVSLTGYDDIRGAGKKWIKDHNDSAGQDQQMFSGDLSLPYQAFLTAHGNERQMRLKAGLGEQLTQEVKPTEPIVPKTPPPAAPTPALYVDPSGVPTQAPKPETAQPTALYMDAPVTAPKPETSQPTEAPLYMDAPVTAPKPEAPLYMDAPVTAPKPEAPLYMDAPVTAPKPEAPVTAPQAPTGTYVDAPIQAPKLSEPEESSYSDTTEEDVAPTGLYRDLE